MFRPVCYPQGMPRAPRLAQGGYVYHLLNRAIGRTTLFAEDEDYGRFVEALRDAREAIGIRLCTWCAMPNHWHLVVWPERDDQVVPFMTRLTQLHTRRHHAAYGTAGHGPLYQGRYRSFLVQADEHFLTLARYVERNPIRAGLVATASEWPWSAASGNVRLKRGEWPVPRPRNWQAFVNRAETAAELERLRLSSVRGRPYGADAWVEQIVDRHQLMSTMRSIGRPRRTPAKESPSALGRDEPA